MNLISEINAVLETMGIPFEAGVFNEPFPQEYILITPLSEMFEVYSDDKPQAEIQEARLSLYSKGNYLLCKNRIVKSFLEADFSITDRHYVGFESDTKYYHYVIDVAKLYYLED